MPFPNNSRHVNANKRNAEHSTGPKTHEGKHASRENAIKHGLAGKGVVLMAQEAAEVERILPDYLDLFRPSSELERGLVEFAVRSFVQNQSCGFAKSVVAAHWSENADQLFYCERALKASGLKYRLPNNPARIQPQLECTYYGMHELTQAWMYLWMQAHIPDGWDLLCREEALDLLAVPHDRRKITTNFDLQREDESPEEALERIKAAIADARERAEAHRDALHKIECEELQLAKEGVFATLPKPLARLQRYQDKHERNFQWCLTKLQELQLKKEADEARLRAKMELIARFHEEAAEKCRPKASPEAPNPTSTFVSASDLSQPCLPDFAESANSDVDLRACVVSMLPNLNPVPVSASLPRELKVGVTSQAGRQGNRHQRRAWEAQERKRERQAAAQAAQKLAEARAAATAG